MCIRDSTRGMFAAEDFTGDMDDAAWHLESIQEKGLPVDEINAYLSLIHI